MQTGKNNISLKVLVAPLNWGLGHATRCIPLINQLLKEGFLVWLAGSGASGKLLQQEFPHLPYEEIPSHEVQYAKSKRRFIWTMLGQLPKLLRQVQEEQDWLKKFLQHQSLDIIISDNRYGLHHSSTHNILITHQLEIKMGVSKGAERILQRVNDRLLKKFNACWVPDYTGYPNLSGALGHPERKLPIPVEYIGPLTRFKPTERSTISKKITIVLSGPEPQRSLLENKCLQELANWRGIVTLVRGLPDRTIPFTPPVNWNIFDHLPSEPLQQEMEESDWIIARCGYSTLMDLSLLKRKALLIPTPGQPEQEYLASWITKHGMALCIQQEDNLLDALGDESATIRGFDFTDNEMNDASNLIRSLRSIRSSQS